MEPYQADGVGKGVEDNSGPQASAPAHGTSSTAQVVSDIGDRLQEPALGGAKPASATPSTYSDSRREQRPTRGDDNSHVTGSSVSALRSSDRAAVEDTRAGKGGSVASTLNTIGEKLKGGTESMMGSMMGDPEIAERGRERQKVAEEISLGANTAAGADHAH